MLAWQLEVTRPIYLLGALIVPLLVYYFWHGLVDFPYRQRLVSFVTRVLIILLLTLSLAGLTLLTPSQRVFTVLAIDESLSVGEFGKRAAGEFMRKVIDVSAGQELAIVPFASSPEKLQPDVGAYVDLLDNLRPTSTSEAIDQRRAWRLGTNLASVIEVAAAAIPPFHVPQVVVLSDGNETAGDALRAALSAGIPISTVALPPRAEPELQISSLGVPAQVRQGEPFFVQVVVDANHDDDCLLDLYRDDVKVSSDQDRSVKIKKGENVFRFRQEVSDQSLVNYSARISGGQDTLLDNNSASGLVSATGKPRVLLIDSDTSTTDDLRWALAEQDIVVQVRGAEGIPDDLSELQSFEVVMLSNVPATSLSGRSMDMIRTYVQDLGGGLIMLGGDQSFGLGGYYKTPLEEILPVRSDFEKEKEKPSLAMVLIIDKSGSMGGMKIELAKDAARGAVDLLGVRDQIGVIAFDGNSYWISEIHSAADKGLVADRIATIEAAGGTNLYPPMVEAYEALAAVTAKLKHVIVLTDGISAPGSFEEITEQMASDQMTVSTVGVGDGADQTLLEMIARRGNGRYYFCDDPQSVPQIFAKETITASKSAINESPFLPQVVRPTQVLGDLDFESAPFLLGFVATRPKPTSELVLATETGEPLLAWWRYGLGMTVAFTSDASSRWAAEWLSWPGFGTFWAQLVRHAMRKSEAKGIYVDIQRRGSIAEVRLDAVDEAGRYRNDAKSTLTVIGPRLGEKKESIEMRQTAPGRYVASFQTLDQGAYHFELSQSVGSQVLFRQTRGLVVGYPDELRLRPTNEVQLKRIAEISGGRFNPEPAELFEIGDRSVHAAIELWPYLLAAAAVLLVLDVALRRIDFLMLFGRGFK